MKMNIDKNLKRAVIPVAAVLIIFLSLLIYNELTSVKYKEMKESVFNWSSKGNINYEVFLKPNILYTEKSLAEGGVYISEFTDNIQTAFRYEFKGDKQADIRADYSIVATVEGYEGAKDAYSGVSADEAGSGNEKEQPVKLVWKKEYELVPASVLKSSDKALTINKNIVLKYDDYNSFAKKVMEASKLNLQTRLTVTMNVALQTATDKGLVEENTSQSIIIPLGASSFRIIKNEAAEKPGTLEEVSKIRLPIDRMLLAAYGAAAVILVILLVYVIFFTRVKPAKSEHLKALEKIFKKYGNRLVALSGATSDDYSKCITVRSIEDIIKISDEVQKPVLYRYDSVNTSISWFFIYDNERMYLFDLCEYVNKLHMDKEAKGQAYTTYVLQK